MQSLQPTITWPHVWVVGGHKALHCGLQAGQQLPVFPPGKKQGIRKRVRPAKERIFRKEEGHVEVMLLAILQLKPLVIKKKLNDESKWWFFSISHEFYTSQITQVYTSQQITMLMNINLFVELQNYSIKHRSHDTDCLKEKPKCLKVVI